MAKRTSRFGSDSVAIYRSKFATQFFSDGGSSFSACGNSASSGSSKYDMVCLLQMLIRSTSIESPVGAGLLAGEYAVAPNQNFTELSTSDTYSPSLLQISVDCQKKTVCQSSPSKPVHYHQLKMIEMMMTYLGSDNFEISKDDLNR